MRRVFIALTGLLWVSTGLMADTTEQVTPPADQPNLLPPVIVQEDEPRYVAPTLRDRIGRIWAPVMINGKGPYRLVLDTGANSSAIIPSVVKSLGVPLHASKKVQLHGVTGSAVVPIVRADSLEVGDLYIDGANLPVVADVFGGAEGILGPKGLGDKRIFIDFNDDLIRIQRSRGESPGPGFTRVPVEFTAGQLLMFEIRIGGIRTKAILDTGAQITLGNNSLREALLRRKRQGEEQDIIGVTLDVQTGEAFYVPTIALGGIEVRNMRVTFGDMFIFEQWKMNDAPAMLIGMDVIGSLGTLVIDYKQRELHMRPRRR
ncbi:MAG TPA: retroviral-like aspartic protease family protein [Steroidobacteraceae bacterium]|nr:retroviral-like aspartic protease family protein [Steroidobacteraceae bacterium]